MIYYVFLINLAVTIIFESSIMALLFRRRDFVYYSVLCNLLTNPALNLLLLVTIKLLSESYYTAALILFETLAVFVEARVLKLLCRFSNTKAFIISCMLNITSYFIGLIYTNLRFF